MTEERFVMEITCGYDESLVRDKQGDLMHIKDCCEMLNDFHKENQEQKGIIQQLKDIIHFDEDVILCEYSSTSEDWEKLHKAYESDDIYDLIRYCKEREKE